MHTVNGLALRSHRRPRFFGGMGQHRCQHPHEGIKDLVHDCLAAAPASAVGRITVHPVFQDIHIDTAHLDRAEIVDQTKNPVEHEAFVSIVYFGDQQLKLFHCPLVDQHHIFVINAHLRRHKVIDVAHQVTHSIANLSIRILQAPDEFIAASHIFLIIHAGHPQTQDIGPVFFNLFQCADIVARGLGLLHAFFIDGKSMRQNRLERRFAHGPQCRQ